MDVKYVYIAPETDGVQGLYIDNECILGGDEYHNRITAFIEGCMIGMKRMGWDGHYTEYSLNYEDPYAKEFYEMGEPIPDNFKELNLKHFAVKKHIFES